MMDLVIFDLDGVLIDSKDAHYECLNKALETIDKKLVISMDEHLQLYDAKPTMVKLKMLSELKGLDSSYYQEIFDLKQLFTLQYIHNNIKEDTELIDVFEYLRHKKCKVACASNSIYKTVKLSLLKLGLMDQIDYFISNEDVKNPKPHPEMFLKCISRFNTSPCNTLILEDSNTGLTAAKKSGANFIKVRNRNDINKNLFIKVLNTNLVR